MLLKPEISAYMMGHLPHMQTLPLPGLDATPSQGNPRHLRVPFILLQDGERH